jgi:hypothetical protein
MEGVDVEGEMFGLRAFLAAALLLGGGALYPLRSAIYVLVPAWLPLDGALNWLGPAGHPTHICMKPSSFILVVVCERR